MVSISRTDEVVIWEIKLRLQNWKLLCESVDVRLSIFTQFIGLFSDFLSMFICSSGKKKTSSPINRQYRANVSAWTISKPNPIWGAAFTYGKVVVMYLGVFSNIGIYEAISSLVLINVAQLMNMGRYITPVNALYKRQISSIFTSGTVPSTPNKHED